MSMSSHRARLAVAAAALATTASLVTAAPSSAEVVGGQERTITIRGIEPRNDRFFIKGRVMPDYENRNAIIQRKVGRDGRWRTWERFQTNNQSRYRERIAPLRRVGRVFYRVKIGPSGAFRTSFSGVVFIRTRRA